MIEEKVGAYAEKVFLSGIDLRPLALILKKPLRAYWISSKSLPMSLEMEWDDVEEEDDSSRQISSSSSSSSLISPSSSSFSTNDTEYTPLLLLSVSRAESSQTRYIQGAGDDEETWACGLTPVLFWSHQDEIMCGGGKKRGEDMKRECECV